MMEQSPTNSWIWTFACLLWLLPLVDFCAGLLFRQQRFKFVPLLSSALAAAGALAAWFLAFWMEAGETLYFTLEWWNFGNHSFDFSIVLSPESRLLLVIVTSVSAAVHFYSLEYMGNDPSINRYYALLGLFGFSMLGIVLSDSLLLMFFFWELVGASSYFLIGFWFARQAAPQAAFKAFIVNRIGDLGFLIGLGLVYVIFQTFNIRDIQSVVNTMQWKGEAFTFLLNNSIFSGTPLVFTIVGVCLLGGAVGKSAQFPLQIWLPDAMQGPTPVSALIHAATMVAAGIYFLARIFFLFTPDALALIAIVGAATAFMGAVSAVGHFDIKKVLAFSTVSQLGFMVMAIGIGGREEGIFHLATHAAFKAALFLAAGSVIHALHLYSHHAHVTFDVQDIRRMGGLKPHMPVTFAVFLVASLALAGIPFFSGFLSKDAIITRAVAWASAEGGWRWLIPSVAVITTFFTAFYMSRLVVLVFFGRVKLPGFSSRHVPTENNRLVTIPMAVMAVASLWIWFGWNPFGSHSWLMESLRHGEATISGLYLEKTMEVSHSSVLTVSLIASLAGIFLGYLVYDEDTVESPGRVEELQLKPEEKQGFFTRLSAKNWFLDDLYDQTVVYLFWKARDAADWMERKIIDRVVNYAGVLGVVSSVVIAWMDKHLLDGLVNLAALLTKFFGNIARAFQGGSVQKYIAWSLFFTVLLVTWILTK